jgi:N-acetylneuraminic acid mutarotase
MKLRWVSASLAAFAIIVITPQPIPAAASAVAHNTWSSGAPMPVAADGTAVAVLEKQIYVVGGQNDDDTIFADTQIFDPATNTWSMGTPLPTATTNGCVGVVKNVLYFIDGYTGTPTDPQDTAAVWAYSPKTQTWSSKAAMPTFRRSVVCVVEDGIIYVMGGYTCATPDCTSNGSFLTTVESYDPATNTSRTEPSMLFPESDVSAGLIGTTIVVTDGSGGYVDGHNQGYNVATNGPWMQLDSDPTLRQGTCAGSIGGQLYSAGGWNDEDNAALTLTESFSLSKNTWETLARMPKGTMGLGRSVIYEGQLYCFGGEYTNGGNVVDNLEIYQP